MSFNQVKFVLIIVAISFFLSACIFGNPEDTNDNNSGNNLTPEHISFLNATVTPATFSKSDSPSVTFTWEVENNCPDGFYYVNIYLSQDAKLDNGDQLIVQSTSTSSSDAITLNSEDSGYQVLLDSSSGKYNLIFEAYCSPSDIHDIKVFSDFTLNESGSENDLSSKNISFLNVTATPTIFSKSELPSITFTWEVKDNCSNGSYYVDVYLSKDKTLDSSDQLIVQSTSTSFNDTITLRSGDSEYQILLNSYGGKYNLIFDAYCSPEDTHDIKVLPDFILKTKWTVMVYMDGDNSLSSYTNSDLEEMKEVGSNRDVNIVTQVDTYSTTKRYFIKPGEEELIQDLGELDMGDPQTLVNFANWVLDNYPADHYLLVLWNHGGGFKRAIRTEYITKNICIDETSNTSISIPQLKEALLTISQKLGRKIDIVGMDACLMSMLEVAYEIKDTANYMVASENTEPGDGWPYDTILEVLINNPEISPADFAKKIVNKYVQVYTSIQNYTLIEQDATLSAIDLSQVNDTVQKVDQLAQALINGLENDVNGTLKTTLQNNIFVAVQRFDDMDEYIINLNDSYADLYDLAYLIKETLPNYAQEAQAVMEAVNATVIANANTGGSVANAYGLSIWFPANTVYQDYYDYYAELLFSQNTNWDEFLNKFLK